MEIMVDALEASGTDVVTVAVRRVKINETTSLFDYIDTKEVQDSSKYSRMLLCGQAIRTAHLARETGMSDMIKLEVLGNEKQHFCPTLLKR